MKRLIVFNVRSVYLPYILALSESRTRDKVAECCLLSRLQADEVWTSNLCLYFREHALHIQAHNERGLDGRKHKKNGKGITRNVLRIE